MRIRVKLVDHRGRTECWFNKQDTQPWVVESKPSNVRFATDNRGQGRVQLGRMPPSPWVFLDGQHYLKVPGLTLHWEKVTPVLDRIALTLGLIDPSVAVIVDDLDAATITVDQLRRLTN